MKYSTFAVLFALIAAIVAIPRLQIDEEVPNYAELQDIHDSFFSSSLQQVNSSYDKEKDAYVWGRTLQPSLSLQLHPLNFVQSYTQKKEFVWISLTAGPWLIGLAILQFNYVSVLTVQIYNSVSGESWRSKSTVPLLGFWLGGRWQPGAGGDVGIAAAGHSVEFVLPFLKQHMQVKFTGSDIMINCTGVVERVGTGERRPFSLFAVAKLPPEVLNIVFPLGPRRAALVSKLAAAPLRDPIKLNFGEEQRKELPLNAFLSLDYTRGLLRRETRWNWASATAPGGYGFHLSYGTYDIDNRSVENVFFVNGKAILLDIAISFQKKEYKEMDGINNNAEEETNSVVWTITGNNIRLRFYPAAGHDGTFNYGIMKGNLNHAWGIFEGTFKVNEVTYTFEKVSGVLEEHYALW